MKVGKRKILGASSVEMSIPKPSDETPSCNGGDAPEPPLNSGESAADQSELPESGEAPKLDKEEEYEEDEQAEEEDKSYYDQYDDDPQIEADPEAEAEADGERHKLADGFYEIEAVRSKRVRKGQIQYLIKWRGWPETANTWEPVENLISCSDVIDAYEESERSGKHRSTRRRKRKHGVTRTQIKKKLHQRSPGDGSHNVSTLQVSIMEEPTPLPALVDVRVMDHTDSNLEGICDFRAAAMVVYDNDLETDRHQIQEGKDQRELDLKLTELRRVAVSYDDNMEKFTEHSLESQVETKSPENELPEINGAVDIQPNQSTGAKRRKTGSVKRFKQDSAMFATNEDVIAQTIEHVQLDRCVGAKRRKPGSVKRFKPDSITNEEANILGQTADTPWVTALQHGIQNHEFVDNSNYLCTITEIIKPISYSAAASNNVRDVMVTFLAKRFDGKSVVVDNKFLKANNPQLLINFYEQHVRYNPI